MTREDKNTFLFRPTVLVEEVQRVVCMTESEATGQFLDYLEKIGPNIILVGIDEDTLGVLMQKLTQRQPARFLKLVVGFTWWSRILKHFRVEDYKKLSLQEFSTTWTPSPPHGLPLTCALVAERLKRAVTFRFGHKLPLNVGEQDVALPVETRARVEQRKVTEGEDEVLEVTNSYLSIPVTTFAVSRMEPVSYTHLTLPTILLV